MKKLSSDALKIIAMVFMLFDHIGSGILEKIYVVTLNYETAKLLYSINEFLRGVGRLAMPIFCYQIAVGCKKTHNRNEYLRNLFVFSLVSEIPYDLLFGTGTVDFTTQNIGFTLLLGVGSIIVSEYLMGITDRNTVIPILCVLTCSAIAELIKSDYGAKGVLLIAFFYFFVLNTNEYTNILFGGRCAIAAVFFIIETFIVMYIRYRYLPATMDYMNYEITAVLAFFLIALDSGKRRGGRVLKHVGYAFYPAHIFILYLICLATGVVS